MCVCARACVCVCARACVGARAWVRVCVLTVHVWLICLCVCVLVCSTTRLSTTPWWACTTSAMLPWPWRPSLSHLQRAVPRRCRTAQYGAGGSHPQGHRTRSEGGGSLRLNRRPGSATHTHTHTHTCTHTHTARTHAHTHTPHTWSVKMMLAVAPPHALGWALGGPW